MDFAIAIAPSEKIFLDKASCLKVTKSLLLENLTSWIPLTLDTLSDSILIELTKLHLSLFLIISFNSIAVPDGESTLFGLEK